MTQGAVSSLASDAIPAHRTVLKCECMTSIACSPTAAAGPLPVLGMTGVVFSQLTVVLHSGRVARGGQPVTRWPAVRCVSLEHPRSEATPAGSRTTPNWRSHNQEVANWPSGWMLRSHGTARWQAFAVGSSVPIGLVRSSRGAVGGAEQLSRWTTPDSRRASSVARVVTPRSVCHVPAGHVAKPTDGAQTTS